MHPWLEPYYQQFLQACQQGRMPSSIIIAGDNGLGVNELAFELAKYYLCSNRKSDGPCGECTSCQRLERYSHQDLKVAYTSSVDEVANGQDFTYDCSGLYVRSALAPTITRTLRVDTLRKVTDFLNETAILGGGKAVIISGAESMNESAANAILKTFEEPLPKSLIIMVTKSLESLLPTILSRATKIVVKEVPEEEALAYLLEPTNQKPRQVVFKDQELEEAAPAPVAITRDRAMVALCLNSYAPLNAMDMLLAGLDNQAIDLVKAIANSVMLNRHDEVEVIEALDKLSKHMQSRVLSELILEVLKYKAYVPEEQLPLIKFGKAQGLARLQAKHLFHAHRMLNHVTDKTNVIPSRAPKALVRAWMKAFKADMAR